jgi:sigma-B regulation protein RsbU (phosphoserine phosphatase)
MGDEKALADELLERYRELNLIYRLSERMAAASQPEAIPGVVLEDIIRLFHGSCGFIYLSEQGPNGAQTVVSEDFPYRLAAPCCLIERVMQTGHAEMDNAADWKDYFELDVPPEPGEERKIPLISAPLKTEKRLLGALTLVREGGQDFKAGDLKLLNAVALQVAVAIEITQLYQVAAEKVRIENELMVARRVQESLLPDSMPSVRGWSFSSIWRPARTVSGDFFDAIPEGNGRLGLVIADVTDKGMPASLFMVFVRSTLRASVARGMSAAEVISATNRLICEDSHEGLFASMFYTRLNTHSGEVDYANAGHNLPVIYRAGQDELSFLKQKGMLLGVEPRSVYEQSTVRLDPGDFILFYTDGVTEAINPQRSEFGEERLIQAVHAGRYDPVDALLARVEKALHDYTGPVERAFDDVTMMVVKRE